MANVTNLSCVDSSNCFLHRYLYFCRIVDIDGVDVWQANEVFSVGMLTGNLQQNMGNVKEMSNRRVNLKCRERI